MSGEHIQKCSDLIQTGLLRIEDGNHGEYRPRPTEFTTFGVAYIRAADITEHGLNFDQAGRISELARKRIRKGVGNPGDVLLSHKGTVGRVALVPDDAPPFVCSPQTTFWRSQDPSVLDPKYLAYQMKSPFFANQLNSIKSESDMAPYVSLTQQKRLSISVPPIKIQHKISNALGALDQKILCNEKLISTAEKLALAITSKHLFETNEFVPLSEISNITRGITPRYSESDSDLLVLNQKCVRKQRINLAPARRTFGEKVSKAKFLEPDDVLVNSTGVGTLGRVARWISNEAATVDSHVSIVRFDQSKVDRVCAGHVVLTMQEKIEQLGEGSTGQTELSREKLGKLLVPCVGRDVQDLISPRLNHLSNLTFGYAKETIDLVALRDSLLPYLISL